MKKIVLISLLLLIVLSQPSWKQNQSGSNRQRKQISYPQESSRTDYIPQHSQEEDQEKRRNREQLQEIEELFFVLMIIGFLFMCIASTIICVMCMRRRAKRRRVQYEMYQKQIQMARSMGLSVHQMRKGPNRFNTIHI